MNGYMSYNLTFKNSLHWSPKYQRKIQSFKVEASIAHYFIDDLFQMIMLNKSSNKETIQIRIIESEIHEKKDNNTKQTNDMYYSYHHKDFRYQRFLVTAIKENKIKDFRNFYGARTKLNNLKNTL